jgi:hypothetical protein
VLHLRDSAVIVAQTGLPHRHTLKYRILLFNTLSGGGGESDNCNQDQYLNAPFLLSVGSHDIDGNPTLYAETCEKTVCIPFRPPSNKRYLDFLLIFEVPILHSS